MWIHRSGFDRAFFSRRPTMAIELQPSVSPRTRCRGLAVSMLLFSRHPRKWFVALFGFLSSGGAVVVPAQVHPRMHNGGGGGGDRLNVPYPKDTQGYTRRKQASGVQATWRYNDIDRETRRLRGCAPPCCTDTMRRNKTTAMS